MRSFCGLAIIVLCGISSPPLQGADFTAGLLPQAPVIDGRAAEPAWKNAVGFDRFRFKTEVQRRRARAWIGATADTLYVAILTQLPDEGELRGEIQRDSLKAVHDDSVEIYVNPTPGETDCVEYQFLVNSLGHGGYNIHILGQAKEAASWQGNWSHAHGFHEGWWHAEFAIPIHSMSTVAPDRKTTDGEWRLNITRNWKRPWEWSSISGDYAHSGPTFQFADAALPVVQATSAGDPAFPPFSTSLILSNPATTAALPVRAQAVLERNNMPGLTDQWSGSLAPGETRELVVRVPENDPTTHYKLELRVSTEDRSVYARTLSWERAEQPLQWRAGVEPQAPPVDIRFAHYPYSRKLRVVVDIQGLDSAAVLKAATVSIRPETGGEALHSLVIPAGGFVNGLAERTIDVDFPHGNYLLAVDLRGSGLPEGKVIRRFERHVFPWERLPVGHSTEVYPPFEPITVTGSILTTVLRQHSFNGLGLLDQVSCRSVNTGDTRPLLAAPMSFHVGRDGQALSVNPASLQIETASAHEVVLSGGFEAEDLRATIRTQVDYDGTARVDLTLQADQPVDTLTLSIPFLDEAAAMIHANADRIRAPVAARLPPATGLLWDARELACDDFIPNFCPYIYLGNPLRGLCWFAENDLNWGWDSASPNLTVERTDEAVLLNVHFINEPTDLRRARTITFGLLAAPVKPRLSPDGTSANGWRYRYLRDGYTLLGTDINWLSMGTCGSVYPAGKNLWLWEMLARGNTQKLDAAAINQVIETGMAYFEPYGDRKVESFKRHVRHNLRSRQGRKMIFYYNRASHQAAEEFETFKDEWCLTDLRSVKKGRGLGEIKVVPTESYIDYHLYWYARSFEIGRNQGVYWDNWFIAPSFNTQQTAAYRREDGSIAPAAGLWALRRLAKRTFVMMNEREMPPITFPHMTSFNPLPLMSFATVQYDWEWKYSKGDIQDRHSREYLLLASTGDLAGVWPVPLADQGELQADPWTQRTFTAVRLLHELDGYGGFGQAWNKGHQANAPLFAPIADLLDEENLTVYRYWEEAARPQPVRSTTEDVHTIVYSVPGEKAVVAVTSYAREAARVRLAVDTAALGFGQTATSFRNVESDKLLTVTDGTLEFDLPAHDVRVFEVQEARP